MKCYYKKNMTNFKNRASENKNVNIKRKVKNKLENLEMTKIKTELQIKYLCNIY